MKIGPCAKFILVPAQRAAGRNLLLAEFEKVAGAVCDFKIL